MGCRTMAARASYEEVRDRHDDPTRAAATSSLAPQGLAGAPRLPRAEEAGGSLTPTLPSAQGRASTPSDPALTSTEVPSGGRPSGGEVPSGRSRATSAPEIVVLPPCASATACTRASPRPVPRVVRLVSA